MYFNKFILNKILKPFLVGSLVGLPLFIVTYKRYKLHNEPAEEIIFPENYQGSRYPNIYWCSEFGALFERKDDKKNKLFYN